MANHSLPELTSTYSAFLTNIKDRLTDLAVGLDPAVTSTSFEPDNAIRWNSTEFTWQKLDPGTRKWVPLSSKYAITLAGPATLEANSSSPTLQLTQTGSGNALTVTGTALLNNVKIETSAVSITTTSSAAAPSIKPGSDTSGFFYLGTGLLGLSINGTETLRFNSTGVGFGGISSPASLIHLGTSNPEIRFANTGSLGTVQARQTGSNFLISVDPENLDTSSTLQVILDGTEKHRTTSDGFFRLASGTYGIQFNGDTALANSLNDYEEGTFTPVVADSETGGATATGNFYANYVKIGKLVTITFSIRDMTTTGMATGNDLYIRNLPFAAASKPGSIYYTGTAVLNRSTVVNTPASVLFENSTALRIGETVANALTDFMIVSEFTTGVANIFVTITYETA